MHGADTGGRGPAEPVPGASTAFKLLFAINLFNYIDRQVLSAVLPRIERDGAIIGLDDANPQFKLGLLTSAFMVAYVIFSPLFGWLDGRGARRWVILGAGVTVWSLASGGSGLASGYWVLFATRCLIGIGEAAYAPVASAMLSDLYPKEQRGKVLAGFNLAIPVGSALGFLIGGFVGDLAKDWRPVFWCTSAGFFLGLLCFWMTEPPRPAPTPGETARPGYWAVVKLLMRNRSFALCCLGMTAVTFVTGGVAVWVPTYVFQREGRFLVDDEALAKLAKDSVPPEVVDKFRPLDDGRSRTYPEMKAEVLDRLGKDAKRYSGRVYEATTAKGSPTLGGVNFKFGAILVLGGIAATVTGAWLGEKLRRKGVKGAYFLVSGAGALFSLPFFLGMTYAPFPLAWAWTFLAIFGLFLYTGPANTILANVVTSRVRATAIAINILIIHALGDMISPPIIGAIADASSLQTAFALTSSVILVGGVLWVWGARYLDDDTAKAEAA